MNIEDFREYCLSRKGVTEETPFGPDTLVYKVMGKMFAATGLDRVPFSVNLKCDPDEAVMLRDIFSGVLPGYHMNKRHWNTIVLDGSIPRGEIERMIDNSYSLVVAGLPRRQRQALQIRHGREAL